MKRGLRKVSLLTQMITFISVVVLFTIFFVTIMFYTMIDDVIETSLGSQAMTVAKMAAGKEKIIQAFDQDQPHITIQPLAEEIRKHSGAGYVVIGNKQGIRYSHHQEEYIGKKMGTSNDPVFDKGESIIYEGSGISGHAIKAKTPIYNKAGEIIGVSSVGFLTSEVEEQTDKYRIKLFQFSVFIMLIGVTGAFLIARRIKKLIFNLEPEEISFLFKEKEATIESIRNATIAVNSQLKITSINKQARELFKEGGMEIGGKVVNERLVSFIKTVIETKQSQINQRLLLGHELFLVDISPIFQKGETRGAVLTLHSFAENEDVRNEFSKIKSISDNIRAQNHEYLNKLNTIYGLITLEQYEEARSLISDEVKERQDRLVFLMSSVKDPYIAACLLGKVNRAKELKVQLTIDEESNLSELPASLNTKMFVTIIGNIIDNAMEASLRNKEDDARVKISFTDIGNDIIFEIEDNGSGVALGMEEKIFAEGFSSKLGENHGLGLALVKNTLRALSGEIYIGTSKMGGAIFTIVIPKL